jgi:glycine/D-amino acid oxidase-like deaminating enzyme
MAGTLSTDICIIGGGSAGLAVAAGASQMGADVVLIEGRKMGGPRNRFWPPARPRSWRKRRLASASA